MIDSYGKEPCSCGSVYVNPANEVLQCHRCGKMFSGVPPQPFVTSEGRGYPCGCVANSGLYAPDHETPAIEYCRVHAAAQDLFDTLLWLYNVVISNIGKSGEEPSEEERTEAVQATQRLLQRVA